MGIKTAQKNQKGFTLVELLIVIVVIAILAAISIVAYNGIQNRANDTTVKSDLASAAKKLELARVDLGRYPETAGEMPGGFKISKSAYDGTANNIYYCLDKANQIYALGFRSKSMKGFIQTNSGLRENVTVAGVQTCQAAGKSVWINDATTAVMQGYTGTTGNWSGLWSWVSE